MSAVTRRTEKRLIPQMMGRALQLGRLLRHWSTQRIAYHLLERIPEEARRLASGILSLQQVHFLPYLLN